MIGPLLAFAMLAVAPLRVRLGLPRLASASRSSASPCSCCSSQPRAAGRRVRPEPAPAPTLARRARRCVAASRASARCSIAGGALSLATVSDAFVFLVAPGHARPRDLRCSRCCSSAARGTYMVLAVPIGPARRPHRPRHGLPRRLRAAARRLRDAAAARSAGWLLRGRRARAARRLLRRDRRRADGARQRASSPEELRGSGLALLGTATSLARLRRVARVRRALDAVGHERGRRLLRRRAASSRRALAALVLAAQSGGPPVPKRAG